MMRRAFVLLTFICTAAACGSTTDNGSSTLDVRGAWLYTGVQTAPLLNISGTLNIDQQSGSSFSGSVQFTETDVQGSVRTRTGQVNGRVAGTDVVDFDVFIDTSTRRHVARILADSMSGTWATTSDNASITGSFKGKRVR